MEKKYRHKVTGEEITYKDGIIKTGSFTLEIECEPSTEYWEEVIEQDYEILEYIDISKLVKKSDGLFYRENTTNKGIREDQIAHFKINKIKRLSDGEIFELGDLVQHKEISVQGKIKSFEVEDCVIYVNYTGYSYLNDVCKVISPFLITEDGEKIYDTNSFVWQTHDYKSKTKASIQNPDFLEQTKVIYTKSIKYCKFFRNKEKAEEYILMNKPCLSIEDLKTINYANDEIFAIKIDKLKELVKSKSL